MSDQATSGEPSSAPATAPDAAPLAAPAAEAKPIGSFGNARGSGLSRGKRVTPPAASSSASSASPSSYKPTSVEVITPQREYTNPFASQTPAPVPVINEPALQAAPFEAVTFAPASAPTPAPVPASAPIAATTVPTPARGSEMFPFTPMAGNEPKPGSPQPQPATIAEKAEIKILPPQEVNRPSVSWGDGTKDEDTRPPPDQRATFRPERRELKSYPGGEQKPSPAGEAKPFAPREPKPFQPREPRRDPNFDQRSSQPRPAVQPRPAAPSTPVEAPKPASGGFFGWLKGLFGGASAKPIKPQPENRDPSSRQDGDSRRRNRGGRGRGGFQGEGRRDYQPRDPRDEPQGGGAYQGGNPGSGQPDERPYEGGGGRRRRRGGRGRNRDDRGGPDAEGQQGGGAI